MPFKAVFLKSRIWEVKVHWFRTGECCHGLLVFRVVDMLSCKNQNLKHAGPDFSISAQSMLLFLYSCCEQ